MLCPPPLAQTEPALYSHICTFPYIDSGKQFSFPFKKIVSLELQSDGLHIFKDGKEVPYTLELRDYEAVLAIVSSILNKVE